MNDFSIRLCCVAWCLALSVQAEGIPAAATPASMPPLTSVRLLEGPFADAVKVNRAYLLALEPDRLLAPYSATELPRHIKPDTAVRLMHYRLTDVVEPSTPGGLPLIPFFRLHGQRYQIYWQLTTKEQLAARRERIAAEERSNALREANTLDWVVVGEQQPEVEHNFAGEKIDSGLRDGRRWRHGEWFQYTLSTHGEKAVNLVVTYWGGDAGRTFDILANDELLVTETLDNSRPGQFFEKRYSVPAKVLSGAASGRINIKFSAKPGSRAGAVYDVRLMKPNDPTTQSTQ